ncbi:MAG: membrane protein of unknown function [Promethearchaeota archaeon]|nr:MAG: membrane protein of unknown function [Candidatus Lokiarchaeota archaeon]
MGKMILKELSLIFNELSFFVFLTCFILYFILFVQALKTSKPTKVKILKLIYVNWVKSRLEEEDPITAVQALRNFIMGNSTFVSALFILLGILVGFYSSDLPEEDLFLNLEFLPLDLVRITANIGMILFCLFNFIMSIRYATRLSLLITGKPREFFTKQYEGIELTRSTLVSAQHHWSYGVRGLFYLAACLFWFVNSILFMFISVIVTVYLLISHDMI